MGCEASFRNHDRIVSGASDVRASTSRDARNPRLDRFLDSYFHRLTSHYLAEAPIAVNHRKRVGFHDDSEFGLDVDITLLHPAHIARDAHDAMRIVTGQICVDQRVGHDPSIFRTGAGRPHENIP